MSFRRNKNEHKRWQQWCSGIAIRDPELPRLVKLLQSQDHFDLFLHFGRFELGESKFMIEQLNDVEWASLIAIVEAYSARWQTYFTKTEYFAFFKELERRTAQLI